MTKRFRWEHRPKLLLKNLVLVAVTAGLLLCIIAPTQAVPAWTRRTGINCNGCHFGGTHRLTKFGEDFLIRGHRLSSEKGIYGEEAASLEISKYLSYNSKFRYNARKDRDPATEFDIEAFSIYLGGPIEDKSSFFVEYYLHERGSFATSTGGQVDSTNRSKLADAYLQYSSDPSSQNYWYGRAGQIYPFLIYTASSGGRVTIGRPRAIQNNVGGNNLYTPRDRAYGASVGLVNAQGIRAEAGILNGGGGNARPNLTEVNNHKDVFGTVEKEFDDFGSGVGLYAYSGKFRRLPTTTPGEESFSRFGLLGQFQRTDFEISGAAFTGRNNDPAGGRRSPDLYYVEAARNLRPDLTAFVRWDIQDNDLATDAANASALKTAHGGAVGISKRIGRMGRIVTEVVFVKNRSVDSAGTGTTSSRDRTWMTELNWIF
ncbi:MAG: hypothetical protein HYX78_15395 [Armatimonadetes bacterium]|nr:hypothetical protein [Armatimonadota bacterium]